MEQVEHMTRMFWEKKKNHEVDDVQHMKRMIHITWNEIYNNTWTQTRNLPVMTARLSSPDNLSQCSSCSLSPSGYHSTTWDAALSACLHKRATPCSCAFTVMSKWADAKWGVGGIKSLSFGIFSLKMRISSQFKMLVRICRQSCWSGSVVDKKVKSLNGFELLEKLDLRLWT